ncbi:MAG: hypothetical protein K0Q76_3187 [Panacagrimonas sp.]|nr:PRC-barrel domain-containing protein [Panacagrimonas sp.]MCC2658079.1 hypothetical protein [Panacagrimonas sp.]
MNAAVGGTPAVPRRIPLHLGTDPGARISLRSLRRTLGTASDGVIDATAPAVAEPAGAEAGTVYLDDAGSGPGQNVLTAESLRGDRVLNRAGERLGNIRDVLLDLRSGRIAYAALSCDGAAAFDDRLRPVPWSALTRDAEHACFVLDMTRDAWLTAPAFEPHHESDLGDLFFARTVHAYYGRQADWESMQNSG